MTAPNAAAFLETMKKSVRYHLLDLIRGLSILSMTLYHAMWDIVNLFGVEAAWYKGTLGHIWQQSICQTFIVLSGFCWSIGSHKLRRGAQVFISGLLVTAATAIFMPKAIVLFGILTFLGSAMLILIPLDRYLKLLPPSAGAAVCLLLFAIISYIDLPSIIIGPKALSAYIGFPAPDFFSTDYFPLIPWIFLYMTGYFLQRLIMKENSESAFSSNDSLCIDRPQHHLMQKSLCRPLEFIGRCSLPIYLMHQIVIYAVLTVFFAYVLPLLPL